MRYLGLLLLILSLAVPAAYAENYYFRAHQESVVLREQGVKHTLVQGYVNGKVHAWIEVEGKISDPLGGLADERYNTDKKGKPMAPFAETIIDPDSKINPLDSHFGLKKNETHDDGVFVYSHLKNGKLRVSRPKR